MTTFIRNVGPAGPTAVVLDSLERPVLERMRARSDVDWGEAPRYNEEYRKIRWPGTSSSTVYFRPMTQEERLPALSLWRSVHAARESQYLAGHIEVDSEDPNITATRRFRNGPGWLDTLRRQQGLKRAGRWTRRMGRQQLRMDLSLCMRCNIPIKTPSFEYKPSDQWVYVHGLRAMKFDLVTGQITQFTYSGVYNKVTSLLLRMFDINVKLQGRKLRWVNNSHQRPGARVTPILPIGESVDIDLDKVYTFSDFYTGAPLWKGFHKVSTELFNEFYRIEQHLNGNE